MFFHFLTIQLYLTFSQLAIEIVAVPWFRGQIFDPGKKWSNAVGVNGDLRRESEPEPMYNPPSSNKINVCAKWKAGSYRSKINESYGGKNPKFQKLMEIWRVKVEIWRDRGLVRKNHMQTDPRWYRFGGFSCGYRSASPSKWNTCTPAVVPLFIVFTLPLGQALCPIWASWGLLGPLSPSTGLHSLH